MADAVSALEKSDASAASATEDKALALLRDELKRLDDQAAETERTIAEGEFRRARSIKPRTAGRPRISRQPQLDWETSASPYEKT